MSVERLSCPDCGVEANISIVSCGRWRGYWVDFYVYEPATGRRGATVTHHSLFRWTANAYAKFLRRSIINGLKECPGA